MRPMRRLFCVLSFLLLLLSAASVAQVGNTPYTSASSHPARHRRSQCNDPGNRDAGTATHGQDGNDRPGDRNRIERNGEIGSCPNSERF